MVGCYRAELLAEWLGKALNLHFLLVVRAYELANRLDDGYLQCDTPPTADSRGDIAIRCQWVQVRDKIAF